MARWLAVFVLVVAAMASALLALGALSNLWADYQDSSTATYLEFGLPWLALAILCSWAAFRIARNR